MPGSSAVWMRLGTAYVLSLVGVVAADPGIDDLRRLAGGLPQGLVVDIGLTDAALATALAQTGTALVHGLVADPAVCGRLRADVAAAGIAGLASVAPLRDAARLPYADRSAETVIADLDALGAAAPPRAELERIAAPGGVLVLRQQGAWQAVRIPRPAGLDDWGHLDHGADGNSVSTDREVGPVRQLQWQNNRMELMESGNAASYAPGVGVRIAGGTLVSHMRLADAGPRRQVWAIQGRSAWTGLLRWELTLPERHRLRLWGLTAVDDTLYCWPDRTGDLAAIDLASGRELRRYAGSARPAIELLGDSEDQAVRVLPGTVLVATGDRVLCYDPATAALRWSFRREGLLLACLVADAAARRVYAVVSGTESRIYAGRWPTTTKAQGIVALDLADGHLIWENREVMAVAVPDPDPKDPAKTGRTRPRGVSQLLPMGDALVVFGSAAISGGNAPFVATLAADTGAVRFQDDAPFKRDYNVASYNVLTRDGKAWFAGAFTNLWSYDPASGKTERAFTHAWNQRCTRFTATTDWFVFGQTAFYGKDLTGEQTFVARSGCALGAIPAAGLLFYSPTSCKCITHPGALQALTPRLPPAAMADDRRLEGASANAPPALAAPLSAAPAGPVASEWLRRPYARAWAVPEVAGPDGLSLVVHPHLHRLDAQRAGRTVWSALADARISGPPLVVGDLVLCGAHDGRVYAWRLADGRLAWSRLVAPAERWIAVDGQLESCWPIYGLAQLGTSVVATAGGHVELAGGITVAAIDPATGAAVWTKRLQKRPTPVSSGSRTAFADHSVINSPPRVEDGMVVLDDGSAFHGRLRIDPAASEADLCAALERPPEKKKR